MSRTCGSSQRIVVENRDVSVDVRGWVERKAWDTREQDGLSTPRREHKVVIRRLWDGGQKRFCVVQTWTIISGSWCQPSQGGIEVWVNKFIGQEVGDKMYDENACAEGGPPAH